MYTLGDVLAVLNGIAPFDLAEDWDNAGLLIGGRGDPATRILLALDVGDKVAEEAAEWKADLIVTHHPAIFRPIKRVDSGDIVYQLIKQGIGVISAHTNLDAAEGGVNDCLASCLKLTNIRLLDPQDRKRHCKIVAYVPEASSEAVYNAMTEAGAGSLGGYKGCAFSQAGEGRFLPLPGSRPAVGQIGELERVREIRLEMLVEKSLLPSVLDAMKRAHPYEVPAYDVFEELAVEPVALGRLGELEQALEPEGFAAYVKERLGVGGLAYAPGSRPVKRVAVFGGAGSDSMYGAAAAGVDALVTSEVKHHQWLDAARLGITLLDGSHYATERVVLEPLGESLRKALPGAEIRVSGMEKAPQKFI